MISTTTRSHEVVILGREIFPARSFYSALFFKLKISVFPAYVSILAEDRMPHPPECAMCVIRWYVENTMDSVMSIINFTMINNMMTDR